MAVGRRSALLLLPVLRDAVQGGEPPRAAPHLRLLRVEGGRGPARVSHWLAVCPCSHTHMYVCIIQLEEESGLEEAAAEPLEEVDTAGGNVGLFSSSCARLNPLEDVDP